MTHSLLALKRLLRPGTIILLAAVLLTVWAGGRIGNQAELRPCGVVCEDPQAAEVTDALVQKGFVPYAAREEMARAVSRGELDCGAVLLPGLGQAVSEGKPAGHILLLASPDAFLTEVYEAHIHSTLYAAAAPAMTVQSAADAGVTLRDADVRAELDTLRQSGYRFTFEILTAEGAPPVPRDLGAAIAQAAASLLLFAAIVPGTFRAVEETDRIRSRIGRRSAICAVLVPDLGWQALLFAAAAGAARPSLLPALGGYILLLTALGLAAARIPAQLGALMPICLLGGLALQPIYFDLDFPAAGVLRMLLPPCWLMTAAEHPAAATAIGAAATAALLVFYPKRRRL